MHSRRQLLPKYPSDTVKRSDLEEAEHQGNMQDMNPFILPSPAPPGYVADASDPSPESPATSRSYSWSMESDPQLFANNAAFWQDVSAFVCSSPQNSFEYRSEDFACAATSPTSPDEQNFKTGETDATSTQPRARGQTLELLLKRRAQNRASQRAYRDRRDQHVRELEAQYEEMAKQNQELTRQNEALCTALDALKAEQALWKAEQQQQQQARKTDEEETVLRYEKGEDEVHYSAEVCLSQMLGAGSGGAPDVESSSGRLEGLVVKVMVCKRCCGGNQVKAKCED